MFRFSLAAATVVPSLAAVSCPLARLVAPRAPGNTDAGDVSAAVVLLAHGFADVEAFGCFAVRCRRELSVAVFAVAMPVGSAPTEVTAARAWPAFAALSVPAAPPGSAPVPDVVSAGSGVVLLDDGVGVVVGVGEPVDVDVPLGDGLGEDELGGGLYRPAFGVFAHAEGLGDPPDRPDAPNGDAEPAGLWWPCPPVLEAPGLTFPEFSEVPAGKRAELLSPTYVPAATTKIARLSAASGRSHLSGRPRPASDAGPNRSQALRMPSASSGPAVCSAARARRKKSVHAASSQPTTIGRGRRSLAWMRSRPSAAGSILAAALCRALRSVASRSLSVLIRHAPARFEAPA